MKINRTAESLTPLFHSSIDKESHYKKLILKAPSDIGVRRNLGRNGARYAPEGIFNVLKKQNNHFSLGKNEKILVGTVSDQNLEQEDFNRGQTYSIEKITSYLNQTEANRIVHIGGGHDHAYPLLMAMDQNDEIENILIINIDAHCDTRVDDKHHSGTPFRDFDRNGKKPFHLIQYGIHQFANSVSTLSPLERGSEKHFFFHKLVEQTNKFNQEHPDLFASCPFKVGPKTAVFFSLDCDAIEGSAMKAVSAVNGNGIPLSYLYTLLSQSLKLNTNKLFFGVYEYNPVFDDLSQLGSRGLTSLLYYFLK